MKYPTLIQPKTFDIEAFAIDVLQFRTENKWTRQEMAALIGFKNPIIIQHIENDRLTPRLNVGYNLCELMGKSIRDYMK